MKKILLILLIFCLNCKQKTDVPAPKDDKANLDFYVPIFEYKEEYFPVAKAMINDTIPFAMNEEQFVKVFGKPDKVMEMPVSDYGSFSGVYEPGAKLYCWMKGKSVFKKKGNIIYPYILDLASTTVSISVDSIKWDILTLSTDVKSTFPMSTRLHKGRHGNGFRGYIIIDASRYNFGDQLWFLLFANDTLISIVFFDVPRIKVTDEIDEIRKSIKSNNKER